ncbi:hypothetical protein CAL7716_101300 (plasmid) [Calothrix sp. PCC 7716]|nr:hypothetical protein CAL7716_101300 [Calothrix sp. PCC 7716]
MIALDRSEAVKRMKRRNKQSVSWTLSELTVEWSYIPATEARDYNGSAGGYGHNPSRIILQRIVWRDGEARYTNYW